MLPSVASTVASGPRSVAATTSLATKWRAEAATAVASRPRPAASTNIATAVASGPRSTSTAAIGVF